jgi:adenosylcobyric acid synthase
VAVVRFPRISNATDAEALGCEPGGAVRYVTEPSRIEDADLLVLPGSKVTVADLAWLRRTGLADAVVAHAKAGRPVLGICGGYQMLGRMIADPHGVEGGSADGLGLLDLEIEFAADKVLANPAGTAWGHPVRGYEIHHGRVVRSGDAPLLDGVGAGSAEAPPGEGSDAGVVVGTHWHGLLENDGFRRALLARVAEQAGRSGFRAAPGTSFAAERTAQLDLLGDLVEQHVDTTALRDVIRHGTPPDLPTVTSGLAGSP